MFKVAAPLFTSRTRGVGVCVNVRTLSGPVTGVQRYLKELRVRLPAMPEYAPVRWSTGLRGHLWEQGALPLSVRGALLWSPSNTGPLAVGNQVVTIHDVAPLDHPEWMNRRFATWYRFLIPRLARRVRHIIVVSESTRQRLLARTGVDPCKISVIYPGVDDRFSPTTADAIATLRRDLALPDGRYVLSVGSLEPRKNLGRLLAAWERVAAELPKDVWLVIAGAKGKRLVFAEVPELNHLPERVLLVGYVRDEDLPQLYAGAVAFAYPSVYEGFGSPPLEAMACGTPVVVGNRTSLPEVVGDAALMVDPYDVDSLARALLCVVTHSDLAARLRGAGLVRARRFSWDEAARATRRILVAAAEGR